MTYIVYFHFCSFSKSPILTCSVYFLFNVVQNENE